MGGQDGCALGGVEGTRGRRRGCGTRSGRENWHDLTGGRKAERCRAVTVRPTRMVPDPPRDRETAARRGPLRAGKPVRRPTHCACSRAQSFRPRVCRRPPTQVSDALSRSSPLLALIATLPVHSERGNTTDMSPLIDGTGTVSSTRSPGQIVLDARSAILHHFILGP